MQNIVYIVLEYSRCVIEPKLGDKCYKPLIAFYNLDLVKCGNHIKLSKVLSTIECVKCLID